MLYSPEMMGLVSALVYLLCIIAFLPFAFKHDIVAATSGGGNKDIVIEAQIVETGRFLHRFPLEKVSCATLVMMLTTTNSYSLHHTVSHTEP